MLESVLGLGILWIIFMHTSQAMGHLRISRCAQRSSYLKLCNYIIQRKNDEVSFGFNVYCSCEPKVITIKDGQSNVL